MIGPNPQSVRHRGVRGIWMWSTSLRGGVVKVPESHAGPGSGADRDAASCAGGVLAAQLLPFPATSRRPIGARRAFSLIGDALRLRCIRAGQPRHLGDASTQPISAVGRILGSAYRNKSCLCAGNLRATLLLVHLATRVIWIMHARADARG